MELDSRRLHQHLTLVFSESHRPHQGFQPGVFRALRARGPSSPQPPRRRLDPTGKWFVPTWSVPHTVTEHPLKNWAAVFLMGIVGSPGQGTTGRIRAEGRVLSWKMMFVALTHVAEFAASSPVLRLRSKRGKLLLESSIRRRCPA